MTENETPPEPPKKPDLTAEERLLYSVLPCGYAWPASRLNGHDMHRLNQIRDATRKPITRLLQEAIEMLYFATEAERAAAARRQAEARERFRTASCEETQSLVELPSTMTREAASQTLFQFDDCQLAAEPTTEEE
jgi:hypothetical protein